MLRWERKELDECLPRNIDSECEAYCVKEYRVYEIMSMFAYFNTKTLSWNRCYFAEIRTFSRNDLTEDLIFHFRIYSKSVAAYAFNPKTNTCFRISHAIFNVSSEYSTAWEFGTSSYFLAKDFSIRGRILRFDQASLQWDVLQTYRFGGIMSVNTHLVDGQNVYFGIKCSQGACRFGLAMLNMETLQWSNVFCLREHGCLRSMCLETRYHVTILYMRDHLIYFTLGNRRFYSFNFLKKTCTQVPISGKPRFWNSLKCSFSMGDRIVFPSLRYGGSARLENGFPHYGRYSPLCFGDEFTVEFNVLNTNFGLKDLGLESILRHKIKNQEVLPNCLRREIGILNKLLETQYLHMPSIPRYMVRQWIDHFIRTSFK